MLLLLGCDAVLTPLPSSTPPPTPSPRVTATPTLAVAGFLTPIPPTPTFTPVPSPTPVIHIVQEGDTFFGIAIEYGVTLNALLTANGLAESDILRIGQSLIIPMATEEEEITDSIAPPAGNMLLPTPTPLPLEIAHAAMYETPVGGVWCMGEVVNVLDAPVTNLQVRATLLTVDGAPLATKMALAAADYLPPGEHAPFAVLFPDPPAGVAEMQVQLLRAEAVSAVTENFVPLTVVERAGAVSGPQYRVTGEIANESGASVTRVVVVVTLYTADGYVMGYRQQVLRTGAGDEAVLTLPNGQRAPFKLLLTPQGLDDPADFDVLVWGTRAP
ncbi:MAG: FxLYD domain-containing protein [Anaerolineales bacterium]